MKLSDMIIKRYEAKDEDELLKLIDEDADKLKGWEGPIEANLRHVRYPSKISKEKVSAVNK